MIRCYGVTQRQSNNKVLETPGSFKTYNSVCTELCNPACQTFSFVTVNHEDQGSTLLPSAKASTILILFPFNPTNNSGRTPLLNF